METSTRNTSCVALIREALRDRPSPAGKNNVAKNIERDLMPYIRELLQHRLSIGAYLSIRQTDSLVFGGVAEHIFRASLREFFSQAPIAKEQQWCAWPEEATKVDNVYYAPAHNGCSTVISFRDHYDRQWTKEVDASFLDKDGQLLLLDVTTNEEVVINKISGGSCDSMSYQALATELERNKLSFHIGHVVINYSYQQLRLPPTTYPCSVHPWSIRPYIQDVSMEVHTLLHSAQHRK